MTAQDRATFKTDTAAAIYTNVSGDVSGNEVQGRLNTLADSAMFKLDDMPGSAVDGEIAGFNGTSGSKLKSLGAIASVLLSLLTTRGDIILRGASTVARKALGASGTYLGSDGTDLVYKAVDVSEVAGAAPLANPALTGNPTVPTQAPGDNSTKAANTAFVQAAVVASTSGVTGPGVSVDGDLAGFNGTTGSVIKSLGTIANVLLGMLTTRGDIIVRGASVVARKALGASGTFLKSDGTDLVYAAPLFAEIASKPTTLSGYGITDAQPLDPDLTAIAALNTDSFGLQLLVKSSAALIRTYIGTVIGTDVQSYDARLAVIAGTIAKNGRLTLTSGLPVTTSDVSAAANIYFTPYGGNQISIHDGTNWVPTVFSELTLALDSSSGHTGYHQSGKNFDLFVINDSGTIRLATGPAWTSDTGRGTGAGTTQIIRTNGVWVNGNTITLRFGSASGNTVSVAVNRAIYVGSFRASADGQATDSVTKRWLWNNYTRVQRSMAAFDATDNWNYTTATWRQSNANTANQLDFLRGLDEDALEAAAIGIAKNSSVGVGYFTGIGLDSTSANSASLTGTMASFIVDTQGTNVAFYRGTPGLGRHSMPWLERSVASGTTTWRGDTGVARAGITGSMMG